MSSTAFELGNTHMSGWIYNYLYRRGKVMFHFSKPNPPTSLPPIPPNNKIIVLMTSNYPVGYELIQYIINLGLVTSNIECYLQKNDETKLLVQIVLHRPKRKMRQNAVMICIFFIESLSHFSFWSV